MKHSLIVLLALAFVAVPGAGIAEEAVQSLAEPSVEGDGPGLGCLDDPNYYCFAQCDYFWDFCVNGDRGCVVIWALGICADNYQLPQCCVHTIREGLF